MTTADSTSPAGTPEQVAVELRVKWPENGPMPTAQAANWFHFASTGSDYQFLVGYFDIREVADQVRRGVGHVSITPDINHRFFLSQQAFQTLRGQIEEMAHKIGLPPLKSSVRPGDNRK